MFGYSWCITSVLGSQVFGLASMASCDMLRDSVSTVCRIKKKKLPMCFIGHFKVGMIKVVKNLLEG